MIRYLAIRNLAVIESVAVDFEHSFNILTGETGAGKSILVEAVGLLLGGRATQDLIRTGEDLATVEAIFETDDGSETDRAARDHVPGPQPRLHQRRARHRRRAEGSVESPRRAARPARTPTAARSGAAPAAARRVGADSIPLGTRWLAAFARVAGLREQTRSAAHGRSRAGGAARSGRVPARRAAEGEPRQPARTRRSPRIASCCAAPTPSSGCAARATPSSTTPKHAALAGIGARLEAGQRAGRDRSALRALPRCARRHQGAARGSGVHAPRFRRRHRRFAGHGCSRSKIASR